MNRKAYMILALALIFLAFGFLTGCSSSSTPPPPPVIAIMTAAGSTPQTQTITEQFQVALGVNVTSNGTPAGNIAVTFSAPSSNQSCALSATSATTDSSGNASVTCTANSTPGAYNVTATATGATTPASFSLTNAPPSIFVFYGSGLEAINSGPNYYAVAGAVAFDLSGAPFSVGNDGNCGEQDYNDGIGGVTATDNILCTGTSLTVDGASSATPGLGTLVLVTGDKSIGPSPGGTETFAVQFANPAHALISQFDGSATSSGSMDLQAYPLPSASGNFAFTISGQDSDYQPVGYGGVFAVSSKAITGTDDVNDAGATPPVSTADTLSGTTVNPDSYGRGTATVTDGTTLTALSLAYYIVGAEAIRLIDIDAGGVTLSGGPAVGSAYGQGTAAGTFSASMLGASVFGLGSNPWGANLYAAAGSFGTTPGTPNAFSGWADWDYEYGADDGQITGIYTMGSNGYGSLGDSLGLGQTELLGLYMTDPNLNLLDPNTPAPATTPSTTSALLLDLDSTANTSDPIDLAGGTGIVIPQTIPATPNFPSGVPYAVGAQDFNPNDSLPAAPATAGWEFDFVGDGGFTANTTNPVTTYVFAGDAAVSDPFAFFASGTAAEYAPVPLTGTAEPDPGGTPATDLGELSNGRYVMATPNATFLYDAEFNMTPSGTSGHNFSVAIYQANPNQLFWVNADEHSMFLGTLEQQSESAMKAAFAKWKPAAKTQPKRKR